MADEVKTPVQEPKNYGDITIPEGVSLLTTDEQPKTSDKSNGEQKPKEEKKTPIDGDRQDTTSQSDEEAKEESRFSIGEEEFTETEIKQAIQDSKNKKKWQESNTQEAQRLAELRKSIEPAVQLIEKLKDAGQARSDIETIIEDKFGEEIKSLVDAAFSLDPSKLPHPLEKEVEELREETAIAKAEKLIESEKLQLASKFKLSPEEIQDVYAYAEQVFEESGGSQALTLEQAYMLKNYPVLTEKLVDKKKENKELKKQATVPDKGGGAKNFESGTDEPKTYKDIKYDPVKHGPLFI